MDQNLNAKLHVEPVDRKAFPKIGKFFGGIIRWCLLLIVLIVPLVVLPWTIDVLELNKQTVLLILVFVGFSAWLGKSMATRSITLTRSWLHIVVAVFIAGYGVVSFFSNDQYLSFVGRYGQLQWSFITLLGFGLFYFLLSQTVNRKEELLNLVYAFLLSSSIVAILALLNIFGVPVFSWLGVNQTKGFNTLGNVNSLAIFLVTPLLLSFSMVFFKEKKEMLKLGFQNIVLYSSILLCLIVSIVVDFWVVWVLIGVGAVMLISVPLIRAGRFVWSYKLLIPSLFLVISIVFVSIQTPIDAGLGGEVSPSVRASWDIARKALQISPLVGTGPGTWVYDYAKHHALEVNISQYWNIRFERGFSAFLTLLASVGLVGISLWLILIVSGIVKSTTYLFIEKSQENWQLFFTVFVGWVSVVLSAFLYNYNVAHHLIFWFLLGLLVSLFARSTLKWDTRESVIHSSLLSLGLLLFLTASLSSVWLLSQRYVADIYSAKAVHEYQTEGKVDITKADIQSSIRLNSHEDIAYRNLSQIALVQTQAALSAEDSDEKTQLVNDSVKLAIESARQATEVAPENVLNWINFGDVLRAIASFTPGADEQAIMMYQEALVREPNNPETLNIIGEIFVMRADAYATLLGSTDAEVQKTARENMNTELENALAVLNVAAQVKPNYELSYYNIALVAERQGRLSDAIVKLEEILNAGSQNVSVAFQLAILYYRNDQKENSQNMFEQIIQVDPLNSNARWYLSALYEEQGLYSEALDQVYKVEEYNVGNELVLSRIEALLKLKEENSVSGPVIMPRPVVEDGVTTPSSEVQEVL